MLYKIILLILIFLLLIFSYNLFYSNSYIPDEKKIDDCEKLMLENNYSYVICKLDGNKIVNKGGFEFKKGDYIGVQVNLNKFDIPFKTYAACFFSDLPIKETKIPEKYTKGSNNLLCVQGFEKEDYHHAGISGYIIENGTYTILEGYVYDNENYSEKTIDNFREGGVLLIKLWGKVY